MRSPTRILAATTLCFEALVVFFAGLVAKDLSSLSPGAAVGLAGALSLACVVTAGLLRFGWGYVVGSMLQVAVVGTGFFVPAMFFLGAVFAVLWVLALRLGRQAERQAVQRDAPPDTPEAVDPYHHGRDREG